MELKNKRVVFLDIDGVLNTQETLRSNRVKIIDPTRWVDCDMASSLLRWVRDNDVVVVGTSSWFIGSDQEDMDSVSQFLGLPIVGKIDHCGGGYGRGLSVLEFVEEHDLTHWAVLDDAGGHMFTYPTVIVNGRCGLTDFDLATLKMIVDTETPICKALSYRKRQLEALRHERRNRN